MNNFKMKEVKLSKKADIQIRMRLAIAQFKKNMQGISLLKVATPVFVFGFLSVGIFHMLDTQTTLPNTKQLTQSEQEMTPMKDSHILSRLKEIRGDSYKARAKERTDMRKIAHYKQYAQVRKLRARSR